MMQKEFIHVSKKEIKMSYKNCFVLELEPAGNLG